VQLTTLLCAVVLLLYLNTHDALGLRTHYTRQPLLRARRLLQQLFSSSRCAAAAVAAAVAAARTAALAPVPLLLWLTQRFSLQLATLRLCITYSTFTHNEQVSKSYLSRIMLLVHNRYEVESYALDV
jgi:hypothetical protein